MMSMTLENSRVPASLEAIFLPADALLARVIGARHLGLEP